MGHPPGGGDARHAKRTTFPLEAEASYGMYVLTSSYVALYRLMSLCVKEVEPCEKLWECNVSGLACQFLFFIIYAPEKEEVPRDFNEVNDKP